jgi:exonuclease SbcC
VLLTRLYLRNFRVYEDELDLALPPGLVGIYGANGAGKSTLLEAITFTLWGKARTGRDEIRSSGVGAECVTEVEFEHEGHLYVVRRSLSGINATMRAQAHCDGRIMAEGATDTKRYLHSVLGMDDTAFRASVFAEQKQLAAFTAQAPAERRRLVLQLLGITPLDGARDTARRDARTTEAQLHQLRAVLPDLAALEVAAADADARAGAAEAEAATEAGVVEVAEGRVVAAAAVVEELDRGRQAYDALVIEGRAAKRDLDRSSEDVRTLGAELAGLDAAAVELADALAASAGLETDRARLRALTAVVDAHRRLDATPVGAEPPVPDEAARIEAQRGEQTARAALAGLDGGLGAARAELARAEEQAERSASLSGEGACPLCGQALGAAFAEVQRHRRAEVTDARTRVARLDAERAAAAAEVRSAGRAAEDTERAWRTALAARAEWEQAAARHRDATAVLDEAVAVLRSVGAAAPSEGHGDPDGRGAPDRGAAAAPPAADAAAMAHEADRRVRAGEQAARVALQLQGRLERRPELEVRLARARRDADDAERAVTALRDRVRALDFQPAALASASEAHTEARRRLATAQAAAQQAALHAAAERRGAEGEARRLADGRDQHALLGDLESRSRHLAKVAVLLSEFRNTVVASVGPRLAAQAAELFGELTDNEYDQLLVDPETYELQISDGGHVYGLDRFSGSEIDLANLALRVAISEHVRFQSGGSVGLLVLDEVFGPLDDERKTRMLQALEHLRGRFRQILVVTHDATIKEQLPNALEVLKRPGRRATARLIAA